MSRSRKTRKSGIDWMLVAVATALIILGLIMQYSASSYDLSLVKKQAIFAAAGVAAMLIIGRLPIRFVYRISWVLYIGALGVTAITYVIGKKVKGAARWIEVGGFTFQPSELLKAAMIIALAAVICKFINEINNNPEIKLTQLPATIKEIGFWGYLKTIRGYILMMLCVVIAALDVALATKDLGTAVIIFGIGYITMWVISPRKQYLVIIGIIAVVGAVVLILAFSYRMDRITAWIDLENNTSSLGYQIKQGLYAIGSGGWFGKGLGKSVQKDVIPEAHTDMIFSIVCEELGIIGGIVIIVLFIILILRLRKIYNEINDLYGKLIVLGVASHIALQSIINLGVLTNLLPNTGVPLPFISYGGTSLLCLMGEIGLVLCARRAEFDIVRANVYDAGRLRERI